MHARFRENGTAIGDIDEQLHQRSDARAERSLSPKPPGQNSIVDSPSFDSPHGTGTCPCEKVGCAWTLGGFRRGRSTKQMVDERRPNNEERRPIADDRCLPTWCEVGLADDKGLLMSSSDLADCNHQLDATEKRAERPLTSRLLPLTRLVNFEAGSCVPHVHDPAFAVPLGMCWSGYQPWPSFLTTAWVLGPSDAQVRHFFPRSEAMLFVLIDTARAGTASFSVSSSAAADEACASRGWRTTVRSVWSETLEMASVWTQRLWAWLGPAASHVRIVLQ